MTTHDHTYTIHNPSSVFYQTPNSMKKIFFPLLLAVLLTACKPSPESIMTLVDAHGKQIPKYRLDKIDPEPVDIKLSHLFKDVRIVPLETKEECMIQNVTLTLRGKYILLSTQYNFPNPARLYLFDDQGKFLREFGKPGRGPDEHSAYLAYGIRFIDDHQFLIDWNPMQIFDLSGHLLHNVDHPIDLMMDPIPVSPDIFALLGNITGYPVYQRDSIFMLYFNSNGKILKEIPRQEYPSGNGPYTSLGARSIYRYNEQLKIRNVGNDTLYALNDLEVNADAIFEDQQNSIPYNKGVSSEDLLGKCYYQVVFESDDDFLLKKNRITEYEGSVWGGGKNLGGTLKAERSFMQVSKKHNTGKYFVLKDDLTRMFPQDQLSMGWPRPTFYGNRAVFAMNAMQAIHMADSVLQRDDLSAPVRERVSDMRSQIDVESNPVLFIFTLKEKIKI